MDEISSCSPEISQFHSFSFLFLLKNFVNNIILQQIHENVYVLFREGDVESSQHRAEGTCKADDACKEQGKESKAEFNGIVYMFVVE